MTRRIGKIKVQVRPVVPAPVPAPSASGPESGWPHEAQRLLQQGNAAAQCERRPYIVPAPNALESAAWYLGSVTCHQLGHLTPPPPWPYDFPCTGCMSWATDQVHQLASDYISKGVARESGPESPGKAKGKRGGKPAAKRPARRR